MRLISSCLLAALFVTPAWSLEAPVTGTVTLPDPCIPEFTTSYEVGTEPSVTQSGDCANGINLHFVLPSAAAPPPEPQPEPQPADLVVKPGDNVQAALDALAAGEILRMEPGRYVGVSFNLTVPNIIIEAAGAEMDGAAFKLDGEQLSFLSGRWVATGLPTPLDPFPGGRFEGAAANEAPTAELQAREDLFVCEDNRANCVKYHRQPPTATLAPGQYATDVSGDRLNVCPHWETTCASTNNWVGRELLLNTTPDAITCTAAASGVTIRGLTVRRYAPQFHDAQVDVSDCAGMRLEDVAILESSSIGWWPGPDAVAVNSRFERNGQLGAEAGRVTVRFEDSSCSFNNTRNFPSWNAGGCKFFSSGAGVNPDPTVPLNRTTWIGGQIVGNNGNGFWTDGSAFDAIVRGALVADNSIGVHLELSYGGFIEDNVFRRNGQPSPDGECSNDGAAGSAIKLGDTTGATVRRNLIYVENPCSKAINLKETSRSWNTKDNMIELNDVVHVDQGTYGTSGAWILGDGAEVTGNVWRNNRYVLQTNDNNDRWRWQDWELRTGGRLSWSEWQASGQDAGSTILRVDDPAIWRP